MVLIIAAIITGLVSLLSAIFTWKQAERVKKIETTTQEYLALINSQTQAAIESFRAEQARSKDAFEVALADSNPIEGSLSTLWSLIQTVKEQIALLTTIEGKLVEKVMVTAIRGRIIDARSKFLEIYGLSGAVLPDMAGGAAHEAKNIMQSIANYLDDILLKGKHPRTRILSKDIDELRRLRERLTLLQRVLTAERSDIRMRQFQKYLDILLPGHSDNLLKP